MTAKFYVKREHIKGGKRVDTGFKAGEIVFRIHLTSDRSIYLTFKEAYDLADALDAALSRQEETPLL